MSSPLPRPSSSWPSRRVDGLRAAQTLGPDPLTGRKSRDVGRFSPYVTDGETNATLPQLADPLQVDLNAAVEMIRNRENAPKRTRPAKGAAAKRHPESDRKETATQEEGTAKRRHPPGKRRPPKTPAKK